MPVIDADLGDVLLAIASRIIAQVKDLSAAPIFKPETCYLSMDPDEVPPPSPGIFVCTVSPSPGNFDPSMLDGGGQKQATLQMGVKVKVHSPVQLDEMGRAGIFLTDATLGLCGVWRKIVTHITTPWMPVDGSGNVLTRDPLLPGICTFTPQKRRLGAIQTEFNLVFDLNLTS